MGRRSIRQTLIESGVVTVHRRGFASVGVREITGAAGVPQGSFSNHFRSKEAFGVAVLDRYVESTGVIIDATLRDGTRAPGKRLHAYFDAVSELLGDAGWRHGCMISNMSLEAAEHSEPLRERLGQIFRDLTRVFADTLRAGQATGEVRPDLDAAEMADVVLAAWNGAMLRMKVDRTGEPLERFKRVCLGTFLVAPSSGR